MWRSSVKTSAMPASMQAAISALDSVACGVSTTIQAISSSASANLAGILLHANLIVGKRQPRRLRQVQAFPRHVRTSRDTSNLRPRRSTVNFLKIASVLTPMPFRISSFVTCGETRDSTSVAIKASKVSLDGFAVRLDDLQE